MVLGQADGHDADRGHRLLVEGRQVEQGLLEMRAVVQARDEHHLGMDLDAQAGQPAQLLHHVGRSWAAKETTPQRQVGGVHRDIERAEPLLLQARPVIASQVGQRDKVAKEEGVAIVVVLDIEGAAHARRVLLDETELAVVGTAADVDVKGGVGEGEP